MFNAIHKLAHLFLVICNLETDLKFIRDINVMKILCSSLFRSFFSIDNGRRLIIDIIQSSFIYLNMFILNSPFLLYPIIHTLCKQSCRFIKKKFQKKKTSFLQCLQKTSLKKRNASSLKQWCFCCSRVNGHSKTRYASLWPGWHAEMPCFILMHGKTLIALQILIT